jgi:predicted lipoprotein with Yx(FWY)xxD motif
MQVVTTGEGREMHELEGSDARGRRARKRPTAMAMGVAVATAALLASLTAIALAAGTAPTVSSFSSSKLGERIIINAQGRTLYALNPETTHHLLCKSSECFKFWPPLTVGSSKVKLKAGLGVHGKLGVLRRSDGMLQVTLGGLPLYRYYEDHAKGQTNGQGIKSFGGTWHVLSAATDPSKTHDTSSTPSAPAPSGGGYESVPTGSSSTGAPATAAPTGTSPVGTTPKEEKTPSKEESAAAREAREKSEKEAAEKRKKTEEEEYKSGW